jgi:hypothetical protein
MRTADRTVWLYTTDVVDQTAASSYSVFLLTNVGQRRASFRAIDGSGVAVMGGSL